MLRPSRCVRVLALALFSLTACATHYAYRFTPEPPPADADLKSAVSIDPGLPEAISLTLTNQTGEVLQINWSAIALVDPGGAQTTLVPDSDLGWVPAGATQTARLIPFALPDRGDAALAYAGKTFELRVPMTVRREKKVLSLRFTAQVEKQK